MSKSSINEKVPCWNCRSFLLLSLHLLCFKQRLWVTFVFLLKLTHSKAFKRKSLGFCLLFHFMYRGKGVFLERLSFPLPEESWRLMRRLVVRSNRLGGNGAPVLMLPWQFSHPWVWSRFQGVFYICGGPHVDALLIWAFKPCKVSLDFSPFAVVYSVNNSVCGLKWQLHHHQEFSPGRNEQLSCIRTTQPQPQLMPLLLSRYISVLEAAR